MVTIKDKCKVKYLLVQKNILIYLLASISVSVLYYFDLLPFTKKEIKDEKTAAGFIKEFGREIVPLTAMHIAPM